MSKKIYRIIKFWNDSGRERARRGSCHICLRGIRVIQKLAELLNLDGRYFHDWTGFAVCLVFTARGSEIAGFISVKYL